MKIHNMLNVFLLPNQKKYTAAYEDMKDQIYFMQTETPTYSSNKKAGESASSVRLNVFHFLCTYKGYSETISSKTLSAISGKNIFYSINPVMTLENDITASRNTLDYMHRFK